MEQTSSVMKVIKIALRKEFVMASARFWLATSALKFSIR